MIIRPMNRQALREGRRGFTLLEVLVVVSIIVMLAGVGGYMLFQRYEEANIKTAKLKAEEIAKAIFIYRLNNGVPPNTIEDLLGVQGDNGAPMLTSDAVLDPWKKPYQFQVDPNTGTIVVVTTGPRGQPIKVERN